LLSTRHTPNQIKNAVLSDNASRSTNKNIQNVKNTYSAIIYYIMTDEQAAKANELWDKVAEAILEEFT
jgi:hypothetical protein